MDSRISTLAIVTADRPSYLGRCLASYREHLERRMSVSPRVLVLDNSVDEASRRETESIIARDAPARNGPATVLGLDARRSMKRELAARGIAIDVLDWLLPDIPGRSAGSARTLALLATAGERFLMVDDDTVCRPTRHPDARDGLAFVGHLDPRETLFFADRGSAMASAGVPVVDLPAAHDRILGRRLHELVVRSHGQVDRNGWCTHPRPELDGQPSPARVRATWTGVVGDAGVWCPYPVLFVAGRTRARLTADEATLRLALSSREVARSVMVPTVTHEPWFMSYCAGVDNTALLPPFSPVGRDEDSLFGAMLRACHPDAFVAQLPERIVHDSPRQAAYSSGVPLSATTIRMSDIVRGLMTPWAAAAVDTSVSARMRGLGRYLMACGALAPNVWRRTLEAVMMRARRATLIGIENVLSAGDAHPAFWRDAVVRYRDAFATTMMSPQGLVPIESYDAMSLSDALASTQIHLHRLGRALFEWPDIWTLRFESRTE